MALYDVSTEAVFVYSVSLQAHMGLKIVLMLRKLNVRLLWEDLCWVTNFGYKTLVFITSTEKQLSAGMAYAPCFHVGLFFDKLQLLATSGSLQV